MNNQENKQEVIVEEVKEEEGVSLSFVINKVQLLLAEKRTSKAE